MAQTASEPQKYVQDRGSANELRVLIIVLDQEA